MGKRIAGKEVTLWFCHKCRTVTCREFVVTEETVESTERCEVCHDDTLHSPIMPDVFRIGFITREYRNE